MKNLKQILNLIQKTGDKFIISDDNTDQNFVIMPFSDYEKIVSGQENVKNLSEAELWDKVDRDIALWKQGHDEEFEENLTSVIPWEQKNPWDEPLLDSAPEKYLDETDTNFFDEQESDSNWKIPEFDWQEDETEDEDKPEPDNLQVQDRFAIPEERLEHQNKNVENVSSEPTEPIKYEDIPPPPNIVSNLIKDSDLLDSEKDSIIDMSFEDEENTNLSKNINQDNEDFLEEPTF